MGLPPRVGWTLWVRRAYSSPGRDNERGMGAYVLHQTWKMGKLPPSGLARLVRPVTLPFRASVFSVHANVSSVHANVSSVHANVSVISRVGIGAIIAVFLFNILICFLN
jgi:hypothetical protein